MILFVVTPRYRDKKKEVSSHAKLYVHDLGLYSFIMKSYWSALHNGKIIENFVFNELMKNKQSEFDEIMVYQKINQSEIDFIYSFAQWGILPIEAKSNNSTHFAKIMYEFAKNYNDLIKWYIQTTQSVYSESLIEEKPSLMIPYWAIGNILMYCDLICE